MLYAYLIAIVLCVCFSNYFSASEMSYSSCNRIRLQNAAEDGDRQAALAVKIVNRFDDALSTILVGNNLVNIGCSSLASVVVIELLGDQYAWLSTVLVTITVIIFGETIPKIMAQENANKIAMRHARFIRLLMTLFRPVTFLVVGLVNLLTRRMQGEEKDEDENEELERLEAIIDTAAAEKVLDANRAELMHRAAGFADISAYEIMTARVDMVALDTDDTWEETLQKVNESPYSRLPVFEGNADNILGILPLNRFLKLDAERTLAAGSGHKPVPLDIRKLLIPAPYVYKTMKLPAVLEELRHAQQHMAIVTDEYGGTLGLVSMEDVLEQLVGEIWDETDVVEKDIVERGKNLYEIAGDTSISDFLEFMDWDDDDFDFESDTIGGWAIEMMDRFPKYGDIFNYANITVKVLGIEDHRVTGVLVNVHEKPEEDE
jgi:putative hemolysin